MKPQDQKPVNADDIVGEINFRTIKRTVRFLCNLDSAILESFAQQYAGIMITLFNVLDKERSYELLQRLTESSILYILKEEVRFLLIREIALAEDVDDVLALTAFFEATERERDTSQVPDAMNRILHFLAGRTLPANPHFSYLSALDESKQRQTLQRLAALETGIALAALPYLDAELFQRLLDTIALRRPEMLQRIPATYFRRRFQVDFDLYLEPGIAACLPLTIQNDLTRMADIHKEHKQIFAEWELLRQTSQDKTALRKQLLESAFQRMQNMDDMGKEVLLLELRSKALLSDDDIQILTTLGKK